MPEREFHATRIGTYKVCPRMYKYSYIDNLEARTPSTKLKLGSGVHKGLEGFYAGAPAFEVYDRWAEEERSRLADEVASKEDYQELIESIELGRKLVGAYISWAQEHDDFQVVAPEQRFRVPIWTPGGRKAPNTYLAGRFDGIARDLYGRLWLLEHKTYKSFPNDTTLRMDEQAGLYLLAATQLFPGEPIMGIKYNIIRKVDPKKARTELIKRFNVLRNGNEIASLSDRLYWDYRAIVNDTAFTPSPGMHCGWRCAFTDLCVAEDDGSDTQGLVAALYKTRKDDDKDDALDEPA